MGEISVFLLLTRQPENGCRLFSRRARGKHDLYFLRRRGWRETYHLIDSRDLGLENRDGVSDRRLLGVGDGRGAEGALLQGSELLVLAHFAENFRKHPLIIINCYTNPQPNLNHSPIFLSSHSTSTHSPLHSPHFPRIHSQSHHLTGFWGFGVLGFWGFGVLG